MATQAVIFRIDMLFSRKSGHQNVKHLVVVNQKRGTLKLPHDVKTIYAEPGLLATVSRTATLFAKPPSHPENYYWPTKPQRDGSGSSSGSDSDTSESDIQVESQRIYPTYLSYFYRDRYIDREVILKNEALSKGQDIIVSPIPLSADATPSTHIIHDQYYQAVTFERKANERDDMPETGNEIVVTNIGFVDKNHVRLVENFERFEGNIFPRTPSVRDIRQGNLGDCFLLSATIAILNTDEGKNYIRSMMKQFDNTTVVRFYHPLTLEPVYIEVENSMYHQYGQRKVRHQAPWVHILEKAYAGFAKKMKDKKIVFATPSFLDIYGEGGKTELALTILTGKEANYKSNANTSETLIPWKYGAVMLGPIFRYFDQESEDFNHEEKLDALLLQKAQDFHDDLIDSFGGFENLKRWCLFYYYLKLNPTASEADRAHANKWLDVLHQPVDSLKDVASAICEFRSLDGFDDETVTAWARYATNAKRRSQEKREEKAAAVVRFKYTKEYGEYSIEESKVFDDIQAGLQSHYMTASTPTAFEDDETLKVPGLRPQHAYAISRAHEKKLLDGRRVKLLTLYNPWGKTGRFYIFKGMEYRDDGVMKTAKEDMAIEIDDVGHFDIELTDFLKYYQGYTQSPRLDVVGIPQPCYVSTDAKDGDWLIMEHVVAQINPVQRITLACLRWMEEQLHGMNLENHKTLKLVSQLHAALRSQPLASNETCQDVLNIIKTQIEITVSQDETQSEGLNPVIIMLDECIRSLPLQGSVECEVKQPNFSC